MKVPRFRPHPRLRRRLLALLLIPTALWGLLLAIVPTDWVRARLVARLERATGCAVRLGALRLGAFGGVRLRDLEIASLGSINDPWLRVDELQLDLHLLNVLVGQCEPARVEAEGLVLRVHRRPDGSFEFGDLLGRRPAAPGARTGPATPDPRPGPEARGCSLEILVRGGRISLVDEPTETHLQFHDVEGHGTLQRGRAAIQELRGQLNGGSVELAAQLDRSAATPVFEGHARARGVALDVGMRALGYLVPVVAGMPASIDGRLDLNLYVRGQGASGDELTRSLIGQGNVDLNPIRLDGSRLLAELSSLLPLPPGGRVGSVRSRFAIAGGRIVSDDLTVDAGRVPLVLSGWTDFDGRLDYRLRQEGLAVRLPREAREMLADLPFDLDKLATLRIQGQLDDLTVTLDGVPLTADRLRRPDERARLREAGRRLRDRLLK